MIDCFVRCGHLNDEYELIIEYEKNTKKKDDVIWKTLMSGCTKYNELMAQDTYDSMKNRFKRIKIKQYEWSESIPRKCSC